MVADISSGFKLIAGSYKLVSALEEALATLNYNFFTKRNHSLITRIFFTLRLIIVFLVNYFSRYPKANVF